MEILQLIWLNIKCFPHALVLIIKDFVIWLIHRGWTIFEGFGIHVYLAAFGQGKTCSMVRDVYNICCKYKDVSVLTNVELRNFPEHTKIVPLRCARDILEAPRNTLVVIDEIGTIWNSRDFMSQKGKGKDDTGISKPVFQLLCQVRHRHIELFCTAQDWADIDVQLRRKIRDVTVCSAWLQHPFTRKITNRVYNAREYDMFYQNPLLPLTAIDVDVYVQTDFIRSLYDTEEMVDSMLHMDYVEVEAAEPVAPVIAGVVDKSEQKKLLNKLKKGGLIE